MQDVTGEPVDKLERCPYCGSEAEAVQDDHSDYESNWTWRVVCCNHADCYAEGEHFRRKEDAIAWWNRRADDADRARLVAQVEAQRREERRMFEDLTPGGSEFHDSPRTVAAYLKDRMSTVIKVAQRAKAAEAQVEQLEAKVTRLTAALMAADEALLAMDETGDDDE